MTTPNVAAALISAIDDEGLNACAVVPAAATLPLVRIEETGGPNASSQAPNRILTVSLQADVWGRTKDEAWTTYATMRDLLLGLPPVRSSVVLSRIGVGAPSWIPDTSWTSPTDRPMPRYLAQLRVTARPTE